LRFRAARRDRLGSASNANGKLTETFANYVQYNRGYDVMGRVNSSTQITGGQTFSMSYGYNLASDPTTVTLPTGRVQTTGHDSANRINLVQDTYNGTTSTHASGFSYFPNRVVETMTLGHVNGALNPAIENTSLDSLGRLQIIARNVQIGSNFPVKLGLWKRLFRQRERVSRRTLR
jgi:hypothetical protein